MCRRRLQSILVKRSRPKICRGVLSSWNSLDCPYFLVLTAWQYFAPNEQSDLPWVVFVRSPHWKEIYCPTDVHLIPIIAFTVGMYAAGNIHWSEEGTELYPGRWNVNRYCWFLKTFQESRHGKIWFGCVAVQWTQWPDYTAAIHCACKPHCLRTWTFHVTIQ